MANFLRVVTPKKNELTEINSLGLRSLLYVVLDKIFKTFSWIILMNSTLEHDMYAGFYLV